MMENKFSSKYEEANSNIKRLDNVSKNCIADSVEFVAFLETNKEFFKSNIIKLNAGSRITALEKLISRISSYSLNKYLSDKDVRKYLFKNRFYTKHQYNNLSLLCSLSFFICFLILSIIFFRQDESFSHIVFALMFLSCIFYILDCYEGFL